MSGANSIRRSIAVTSHAESAAAARDVFERGGNAVDAACAAVLALCVTNQGMVGLGGYGGSMVAYLSDRGTVAIDFDSRAPLAYRDELFINADKSVRETGYLSVTVPGVVAGIDLALRQFGKLTFRDAAQPALRYAEQGFRVDDAKRADALKSWKTRADAASFKALFPSGNVPALGESWVQPNLAKLIRRLCDDGPAAMYRGEIPRQIVRQVHDHGGILTEEDFAKYEAKIVEPLSVRWRGHTLVTPPPPSGGLTTLQILKVMKRLDAKAIQPWGPKYFHRLAEVTKACWRERERYIGDPDVVKVPIDEMLSDQRAAEIARGVPDRVGDARGGGDSAGGEHTVNVLTADREGNVVSLTATQGAMYGAYVAIDGLGLVLGHGMSRFTYTPDSPNAPAAGKRMQHNMSPIVALRADGRPAFAVGMPGGEKIVNVTAQITMNLVEFNRSPVEAVKAPRLHTIGEEPLTLTRDVPDEVAAELERMGHKVERAETVGGPSNALAIDERGNVTGACETGQQGVVEIG